jgi:transposase-like protein
MKDNTNPIYHDEDAARKHLERLRWPDGTICPYCDQRDTVKPLPPKGSMGKGWYHCSDCRRKFTVRVGTVYERSHIPLHKWVYANHLLVSSKKGMSAHQLHRMLGVTYKTAWFMAHRIREAMREVNPEPMGGSGQSVQADETYFGAKDAVRGKAWKDKKGHSKLRSVVSLVSGGKARTFQVAHANARTVRHILVTNAKRDSELHTDESGLYRKVGREFAAHKRVVHSRLEYVGPSGESTNAVENYFSIFKRGMKGIYQHCSEKHLQRYLNEFDFRYNTREITDGERADKAIIGAEGKRLTYRRTGEEARH